MEGSSSTGPGPPGTHQRDLSPCARPRPPGRNRPRAPIPGHIPPRSRRTSTPLPRRDRPSAAASPHTVTPQRPLRRQRPLPQPAVPGTPTDRPPPQSARAPRAPARSPPDRGSPPARAAGPRISDRPARQAGVVPHLPPFVRDAPAGGRLRPAHDPEAARPRGRAHDDDLHARAQPRSAWRAQSARGVGSGEGAGGGGVGQVAGADNAATPATAAVCRQQAERRARARLRVPHRGGRRRRRRQRLPWADLLRRAFGIDVLVCSKCAGSRRVLAAIHDPAAIPRVLGALGLTAAEADPSGCRAPPAAEVGAADEGDAAE